MEKKNHNELYAAAQDIYLAAKTKKEKDDALVKMYYIAIDYYHNYLCSYAKKRSLCFTPGQVEEIIHDCATRTITHYLEKPEFKIDRFTAYAYFDFLKIITKDQKYDETLSYEQIIESYDDNEPILEELEWQ